MTDDHDKTNPDRSVALGEKALGYIKYNLTSAAPDGYELWFNYASGAKPELNQSIKALLAEQPRITQDQLDKIYSTHFHNEPVDERMEEISSKVSVELSEIMDMVGSSLSNTENYSESLEVFTSELADIKDEGSLRMMISSMVTATFEMAQNTKELESNLARSKDQITKLNSSIESIRAESMTDALTGIANRKKFDVTMERETVITRQASEELCLLLCDIDFFKKFNDTHGHQAGDMVLQAVSRGIMQHTRQSDTLCRWGGEEFILLLDNCPLDEAVKRANIIREAIKEQSVAFGRNQIRVTLSIGVTEQVPGEDLEPFIARADAALYQAKEGGRDQVVTAR